MEKERGFKIIAIVALIVAVAGVSIGFAAFSKDLVITSTGTVTPDDLFTLQFSEANGAITKGTIQLGSGTTADASGTATITGDTSLTAVANFKKPGDVVEFDFYVTNTSAYIAYLKNIVLSKNAATCTATTAGQTVANMADACADMDLTISVGGSTIGFGEELNIAGTNSIAAKVVAGENTTYSSMPVKLTLTYGGDNYVDGGVTVDFGTITLGYSTSNS